MGAVPDQFIDRNKIGSMTCHVGRALDETFLLQIVHQPIVERIRGFVCASKFGKFVARQLTPSVVIERVGLGEIDTL